MKKAVFIIILLTGIFSGCAGINANEDKSLNDYLKLFNHANSFQYNLINEEIFNIDTVANGVTNGSINSYANSTFVRKPYFKSTILTTKETLPNSTVFVKTIEEFSGDTFEPSRFITYDIEASDFSIDDQGNITLNEEFENAIKMEKESLKGMPLSIKQLNDPFLLIVFLMEQNLDSFQVDKNNKNEFEIVYRGQIKPDTLVDYYIYDGNEIFKEVLYGDYGGNMTRDALKNETIKNNYNTLVEPLNALLFTDKPALVTFTVNTKENTYDIIIDITNARNELYKEMYADTQAVNVEKRVMEYKNITIKE
ncbi:hypothetical protein [Anoxynatronum sibiricum]|uniref:Lipoprotein n=1 Tax=Anoxynatronum sibiricum TaxID=210623 RepID=A0ABU9VTJ9_9CLOT